MLRRDDICVKGPSDFDLDIVAGAEDAATQGLMSAWNAELLPRGNVFVLIGRFSKSQTQINHQYRFELLKINEVVTD